MNDYRIWAKEKGYCLSCYKEKAWNGRTMCPKCLDKTKVNSERTRSTISKEQRKRYINRKRDLCIAFKICRECFKRKASVGLKCLECHVKEVKRNSKKRKVIPRVIRNDLNLCYFCGEKVLEGKKTCEKHHKILVENLNYKRDTSKHIWRAIQKSEVERINYYKEKNKKVVR